MSPIQMNDKLPIRKQFILKRKEVNAGFRALASIAATQNLLKHSLFQSSQHIACYYPYQNEFDSLSIIEMIGAHNKQCYLPVISKGNKLMRFVLYRLGDPLHSNSYFISEPAQLHNLISPNELDMVIMPLLSFDQKGYRLGTGGGYYDHTFSYLLDSKKEKNRLVGLGFSNQETNELPIDSWDVPMHSIITEKEIIYF
jgi:5-formyltetrahydrofolate cyclo-ligase